MTQLREADPAARRTDADGPPPRYVLERILETGQRRRPRRRRVAIAAVAGAVAVAVLLGALARGERSDLAARAYAATTVGDQILYTELTTKGVAPGMDASHSVERIWQQGDRVRRIHTIADADGRAKTAPGVGRPWVYEYVQEGDITRLRMPDGKVHTVSGPVAIGNTVSGLGRANFVEAFRARYANAVLHDAGRTIFAGRSAQAYEVDHRRPGLGETYYLDPDTGLPLGSVRTFALGGAGAGVGRMTEVVHRLERLPASPENLALLTAPWADASTGDTGFSGRRSRRSP